MLEGRQNVSDEQIKDTAYQVLQQLQPGSYISVDDRIAVGNHVFNSMAIQM